MGSIRKLPLKHRIFFAAISLFLRAGLAWLSAQNGPEILDPGAGLAEPDTPAWAEKAAVALVPFWGEDGDIREQFGEALRLTVEQMSAYRPVLVDMKHLPADVPEGGFPPYVCPSPSLTALMPYALTGEILHDGETGRYHLRLYLWEMAHNRLLYSDEMTAENREEADSGLPALVEWLFARAETSPPAAEEAGFELYAPPNSTEHRLFLGLRAGTSLRFYSRPRADPFVEKDVHNYFNLNIALQASVHFNSLLGVQAEAIFTTDYAPFKSYSITGGTVANTLYLYDAPVTAWSLMIPLALKITHRDAPLLAAGLAGLYLAVPLGNMQNNAMGGNFGYALTLPIGYTVGVDLGMKAGPGYLFLDLRWAQDLGDTVKTNSRELIYRRSMISLSVGYELGFFRKR
jgi:hypothetical protein